MTVSTFFVFNGAGPDHTGDTYAANLGSPWLNNNLFATAFVGRGAKGGPELDAFMAFDVSTVTLGSVINGLNLGWRWSQNSEGTGGLRIGYLIVDGKWDVNGFSITPGQATPGYTALGDSLPHASLNGNLAIIPGRIVDDAYATAGVAYAGRVADTDFVIGDGFGGEDQVEAGMVTVYNKLRNHQNRGVVAVTLDSQQVSNAANRVFLYLTETGGAARPTLVVDWTENPPAFTSTGTPTGTVGIPYVYTATANPWSLGDQTDGNQPGVAFFTDGVAGVDFPTGMTIDQPTGVVTWIPNAGQVGTNLVTLRVFNNALLSVTQAFNVEVTAVDLPTADGDIVVDPQTEPVVVTPEPHKLSVEAATSGLTASPEPHAISVEARGGPLSVTVVSGDITIEKG